MKPRKRTSNDGSFPVITKRSDGKYSVAISDGRWSEPAGDGLSRFFVKIDAPSTEFAVKECDGTTEAAIYKARIVDVQKTQLPPRASANGWSCRLSQRRSWNDAELDWVRSSNLLCRKKP
jgi:hypothetical protein